MTRIGLFLCLWLSLWSDTVLASVLAIDYGADFIKASLMKPGQPFDVLLDRDSKRKMQTVVGWKKEDRLFGKDAANVAGRFPLDSFSSLKFLLAAPYDSDATSFYTSIATGDTVRTERGTVALRRSDGTQWAVEELIAMQFAYVRDLAESTAGEKVNDVIVTVPPYYTQFERDAVVDAIEISGLRTLALVNDGTAVAVNYAMTRAFPEPEVHVIFDAGASSVRATVVEFAPVPDPKAKTKVVRDATQITVHGVGYDRYTGGTELVKRLRDMMLSDFQKRYKRDISNDKRAMAKLWKEADRIKAVLSANQEAQATIESLAYDIDYKGKFSRSEFEAACRDLKSRFAVPIREALVHAGLKLDNVSSIIFTGGASRTPMVQEAVRSEFPSTKLAFNVNADEAAVLGAALHGAGLSRQFKTKDIRIADIGPYDIQASYQSEVKQPGARPRTINTLVFPVGSKTSTKKTLSFKRTEDFSGYPAEILEAHILGVADAIKNLTEAGGAEPVVKATVMLSESGFASIRDAVLTGEFKDESITGKLKDFFGKGSSESVDETTVNVGEAEEDTSTTTSSAAAAASAVSKKEPIPLEIESKFPALAPMSVTEKRVGRERLKAIDTQELSKRKHEEARNTLEGYIYKLRDLLSDESPSAPFMKCSQSEERKKIAQKVDETLVWLNEHGDDANTAQYIEQRSALETLERPIVHRYKEIEEFPQALNNSQLWNWHSTLFLEDARANLTRDLEAGIAAGMSAPLKYTKEELDDFEKTLKEHESWLDEWVEKQKKVKMNEDPVILTSEMRARAKVLENHLQRLYRKPPPKKPKKTSSSTAKTATTSEAASASESASASSEPVKHEEL
ncbi:actin-like ATPase domain-containing protein [Epithele typhae]|uniref:actin-like ATPase domain-containing protein n=1 Tax=Epithele typhae TaxID=378194 RepID=UPI002007980A|nr:actin-like ATPase domain-containing protein [Epithele typhae]KAH9920858.1 actin-like ATPase domain-containing protein [Epithele typhae]